MNDFEIKIRDAMRKEIEKPLSYEYAIKNAFNNYRNKRIKVIVLRLATVTSCLVIIYAGVIAATYIINNVWKEPIVVTKEQDENNVKEEVSLEEKINFITEERAVEIANKVLKTLGYENMKISEVELRRGYDSEYSSHYILKTDNILININPKTGKLEYFGDTSVNNKNVKCDNISDEEINKIANDIYFNILGEFIDNKDYKIVNTEKINMVAGQYNNELYEVKFGKNYNGKYDENSVSAICFAVSDGNTIISSIRIQDDNFEDNPIIISQEEAIEIATNKEKEFSSLEISNIEADLSIEKMNIFIYCLENNITNEKGELKVDDISRNVWVVNIKHDKKTMPANTELETIKQFFNKKYYVDATTGEIIGGEQSELFTNSH